MGNSGFMVNQVNPEAFGIAPSGVAHLPLDAPADKNGLILSNSKSQHHAVDNLAETEGNQSKGRSLTSPISDGTGQTLKDLHQPVDGVHSEGQAGSPPLTSPTSPSAFQEQVQTPIRKQKMGVKTWKKVARLGDRTSLTLRVAGAQSKKGKFSTPLAVDGLRKSRYEAMDLDTPNTTETAATASLPPLLATHWIE